MKRYSYFEALISDSTDTNFLLLFLNLDPKNHSTPRQNYSFSLFQAFGTVK